jgi:pyruvate formate lyase activating enzyme
MTPLIVNIKRNSLDDGPGIRTVIFFKGCPLSCVWCQNPEAIASSQEISFDGEDCINCGKCLEVCDQEAINFTNPDRVDRTRCSLCGKCIEQCPSEALQFVGREYTIEELLTIVLKDKVFYKNSGGGVTLSGGEPTLHIPYLNQVLRALKQENIHVTLETCGYYNSESFNELILPYLDLIFFDLKIYDTDAHQQFCGVPNSRIQRNFEELIQQKKVDVLPRIPLIPTITATEENLKNMANYLKTLGIKKIGFLPYNPLWLSKMDKIGAKPKYIRSDWLKKEEKKQIKHIFSDFEFNIF